MKPNNLYYRTVIGPRRGFLSTSRSEEALAALWIIVSLLLGERGTTLTEILSKVALFHGLICIWYAFRFGGHEVLAMEKEIQNDGKARP